MRSSRERVTRWRKTFVGPVLLLLALLLTAWRTDLPAWKQVNSNGFGAPQATEVSALEPFNGYLYAGTANATDGARIYRAIDAETWTPVTDPGFGDPHDIAPPAILDLMVFDGRLYASTGRGDGPGHIWRTLNGLNWAPVVISGFGDPDNVDITALASYQGQIYAGVTNLISGAQIWRSFTGDSNSWQQVAPAMEGSEPAAVTGFAELNGALYAAVQSATPVQVWRSYGGAWSTIVDDGFGNAGTTAGGGLASHGGYLYVGAGNSSHGAELWRSADGETWMQVIEPGFGDPNNEKVEMVLVFQNELYVSVQNALTGMEVWRHTAGTTWQQVNDDGFGDSLNMTANGSNGAATYLSRLHIGTANQVQGGELWQMTPGAVYGVTVAPDASQWALPSETVRYTLVITNTGNISDTYGLTIAGSSWPATLSSTSISLAPGAHSTLTVTVTVPAHTPANVADEATITAMSQGDMTVSDSALLTTVCSGQPRNVFLPIFLRNTSQ